MPNPPTAERPGRAGAGGPLPEKDPETSPLLREVRRILALGDYASAVRTAYRAAFNGTVRAYGLSVPISCTDRQFVSGFLRTDMGKLSELLPELERRYEPVRFGKLANGDPRSLETLVLTMVAHTVLGRIEDPLFQPTGPALPTEKTVESAWPFLPSKQREAT